MSKETTRDMTKLDRRQKGRDLAFSHPERVERSSGADDEYGWSVTGSKGARYAVHLISGYCGCPDYQKRISDDSRHRCYHWWACFYTAIVPVSYRVRKVRGEGHAEGWTVALTRLGVMIDQVGHFRSFAAARVARDLMEEGKSERPDARASEERRKVG